MKRKIVTEEYDKDGNLVKRTTVEEEGWAVGGPVKSSPAYDHVWARRDGQIPVYTGQTSVLVNGD